MIGSTSPRVLRCLAYRRSTGYLRSDAFEKRRRMMQMWADFCDIALKVSKSKVVPIREA